MARNLNEEIMPDHFGDSPRAKLKYYQRQALFEWMKENGLTRKEAAEVLGIPQNHLTRVMDINDSGAITMLKHLYIFQIANNQKLKASGKYLRSPDMWYAITGQRGTEYERILLEEDKKNKRIIAELRTISSAKDTAMGKLMTEINDLSAQVNKLKKQLKAANQKSKLK